MGIAVQFLPCRPEKSTASLTMKFLVVLALFAAAAAEPEAEADPYYFYANGYNGYALGHHYPYTYGYGYPYHSYYLPTVVKPAEKAVEEAPAVEEKKAVVTAPYYYHPYAYGAYNYAPAVYNHAVVKPYTYYANSGGAVHIVKREAEAEAEADPKAWYGYAGYHPYSYGYGYGHRYSHYAYPYAYSGYSAYRYPYSYGGYGGYYYGKQIFWRIQDIGYGKKGKSTRPSHTSYKITKFAQLNKIRICKQRKVFIHFCI